MKPFLKIVFSIISFCISTTAFSQINEGFEGTSFPPSTSGNWAVLNNGIGTTIDWTETTNSAFVHSGSKAAIIDREGIGAGNTSQDWLITPRVTLPANGQLRFWTRQTLVGNNGSTYEIRVSTDPTQTNQAAFTTVQTWTETTLNNTYNVYEEKLVNFPGYSAGTQVYIAFVKINTQPSTATTGDRWIIDDVKLVEQCMDPSILTATLATPTTVTLNWQNNGSATVWDVYYSLFTDSVTPNASTIPSYDNITGNSYLLTGLTPQTEYKYWIRSECSGGVVSNWVGPFNFLTTPLGSTCDSPIVVNNLPFSHSGNTNTYINNFDTPQGGSCAGGSTNFMHGPEAFYSFTPNTTGVININVTSSQPNSSLFVYNGCGNFPLNCIASVANISNNPRVINSLNVVSGQTYIIVISSSSYYEGGIPYTIAIDEGEGPCVDTVTGTINFRDCAASKSVNNYCEYNCGQRTVYPYVFLDYPISEGSTYTWTAVDSNGNSVQVFQDGSGQEYFTFNTPGINTIQLTITNAKGCVLFYETKTVEVIKCPSCTATNKHSVYVKQLFKNLINKLRTLPESQVVDGFYCQELLDLSPFITDSIDPKSLLPGIYNFRYEYSTTPSGQILTGMEFSFARHDRKDQDVLIPFLDNQIILDFDLSQYDSSSVKTNINTIYTNTTSNSKGFVRHVEFCPKSVSCTKTNPKSQEVNRLFVDLLHHIIQRKLQGDSDDDIEGSNPAELQALAPYITDANPRIYNFISEYSIYSELNSFQFSFSPDDKEVDVDMRSLQGYIGIDSTNFLFDLSNYNNPDSYLSVLNYNYEHFYIKDAKFKHINFCPEEKCVNHVAIIVDESGSIDVYEKAKIKRQLKWFLKQQADINDANGGEGNMHISLIGMSDSDKPSNWRTDNLISIRISNSNINQFNQWVDAYGNRSGLGISAGSDFWRSGLETALASQTNHKLDLAIMITDGSQAATADGLKATMLKFNNNGLHQVPVVLDPNKPHLYVIGIENGFYVYNEQTTNMRMTKTEDPNYNPKFRSSTLSSQSRTTPALALSLKYLFNLASIEFPYNDINDFGKDYFGHTDFSYLGDPLNEYYISSRIKSFGLGCPFDKSKDNCEDCYSFQPLPGKTYVLNAWCKEELNIQVNNYQNPQIKLRYFDVNESHLTNSDKIFSTKGEIIEGWQRIGDKFEVPADAVFMEIELINSGNSTPVFFDDIRIYPIKASMKSFVYDPETFRLMSELDENNYATYYEYDSEGGLIRIKKETVKGIKTIQESRSGNVIKPIENED